MGGGGPGPRELRRRWRLRWMVAFVAGLALLLYLRSFYRHELYHLTGAAAWMWVSDDVAEPRPTAGLFVRTLELAARPRRAVAKVSGDRQYVLWVNGEPVAAGRSRPGFPLDVVPVTDLLRPGRNVLALEVRSPTSVGAALFALDLEPTPEGRAAGDPAGRSVVVSGRDWRVLREWSRDALDEGVGGGAAPWIWGSPPDHPWSYPVPRLHAVPLEQAVTGERWRVRPEPGDGVWRYRLGEGFGGLVWLTEPEGGWRRAEVRLPDGGAVPVVALPGEREWLFPGRWEGAVLEIACVGPPPGLLAQPTRATRVR